MSYKKHGSLYEISSPNGDNYLIDQPHISYLRWRKENSQQEIILGSNQVIIVNNNDHVAMREDLEKTCSYMSAKAQNGDMFLISEAAIAYLRWRKNSSQQEVILGSNQVVTISTEEHESLRNKLTKPHETLDRIMEVPLETSIILIEKQFEDSLKVLDQVGEKIEKRRGRPKQSA